MFRRRVALLFPLRAASMSSCTWQLNEMQMHLMVPFMKLHEAADGFSVLHIRPGHSGQINLLPSCFHTRSFGIQLDSWVKNTALKNLVYHKVVAEFLFPMHVWSQIWHLNICSLWSCLWNRSFSLLRKVFPQVGHKKVIVDCSNLWIILKKSHPEK